MKKLIIFLLFTLGLFAEQKAIPIADIQDGDFTECVGDADASHWDELNTYDDEGSMWNAVNSTALEHNISAIIDPSSSSNHTITVRARKTTSTCTSANSGGADKYLIVVLKQGTTTKATANFSASLLTSAWTDYTYTLSGAEADSISDYTTLRLNISCQTSGGGAARYCSVTYSEFSVPDAPPNPGVVSRLRYF